MTEIKSILLVICEAVMLIVEFFNQLSKLLSERESFKTYETKLMLSKYLHKDMSNKIVPSLNKSALLKF